MAPFAIVAGTVVSYAAGWALNVPALVPVLNTAAAFPFMVAALKRQELRLAVGRMLLWALAMGVCATAIAYAGPWEAGRLFVRGAAYRAEMFAWVMTGRGAESSPSVFIPQQAGHAALFAALALATGGLAAMPMGAVLMNYMGTYAGSLAAASKSPALAVVLAWHPWAVIRVASFVVAGVVLSAPVLSRLFRFRADWRQGTRLLTWAAAGLVADVLLKATLAPWWQRLLLRVAGW